MATFTSSKNTTPQLTDRTLEAGTNPTTVKQEAQPSEWDLQASIENGTEQALPAALLLGMLVCGGSLATSAAMMGMHIPVHTVLCLANRTSPTTEATAVLRCYPNFFVTTWTLMFISSAISFFFYAFLCLQQRELRLRQSVAMLGSFITLSLWLSTICIGFLPTQVGLDSTGGIDNTPQVRAYGMLTSSIFNYQVAHNRTQLDVASAILENSRSPDNDASQLVWIIGERSGGNQHMANGSIRSGIIASIYRANGNENRFWYKLGSLSAISSSSGTQPATKVTSHSHRLRWYEAGQPKEIFKVTKRDRQLPAESFSNVMQRAEPTPVHILNMYNSSDFYKQETDWAVAATGFASLSFLLSLAIFVLLSAFPFI